MKCKLRRLLKTKNKRGATVIMVALSLVIVVGVATFAVDIGYLMVARNQLQNIADAAALAATRQLGGIYVERLAKGETDTYTCDPSDIVPVAQVVGAENQAGGVSININSSDVIIGKWNFVDHVLIKTLEDPDAVKVIARRDSSANGPIATFFSKILGINSFNVSAGAVAALSSPKKINKKGLPIPVGISKEWFAKPEYCNQNIQFYPTGTIEGCAGWHSYNSGRINADDLREILEGLGDGSFESPETIAGETQYSFTGGNVESVLFNPAHYDLKDLFDAMKVLNDGEKDLDDDPNTWTTAVVVYGGGCENPKTETVAGFAAVTISSVDEVNHQIGAKVVCEAIKNVRGGGGGGTSDYGTKGSIPGLVK